MDGDLAMTLDEIKAMDKPFLLADQIAPIMGWNAQWIRICAREGTLPFQTVCHGKRVQIVRKSFLEFMGAGT